ncbi:MAG: hypothetical protein AB1634_13150 [Thermodesulfobacteriota bacterium]
MRTFSAMLMMVLMSGCAAGVQTPVASVDLRLDSPLLGGGRRPVIYPDASEGSSGEADPFARAFGAPWRSVATDYPELSFNP